MGTDRHLPGRSERSRTRSVRLVAEEEERLLTVLQARRLTWPQFVRWAIRAAEDGAVSGAVTLGPADLHHLEALANNARFGGQERSGFWRGLAQWARSTAMALSEGPVTLTESTADYLTWLGQAAGELSRTERLRAAHAWALRRIEEVRLGRDAEEPRKRRRRA